jgi:hypothetical protein
MTLQEKIQKDMRETRDPVIKSVLRIVLGELQRQPKKELSDLEVERIIKKLCQAEEDLLKISGKATDHAFLAILNLYLPEELTEEQIEQWIRDNVDFSSLKNKMQAISIVTKHFGSAVDGKIVKKIVSEKF